ncbi:MAG: protein-L-isoaspartate(D-aspartate) O-methyltransferase [Dehalococcoidia bacterium]|nr:protein-L-isoaspartate(D-aspartate) O-methyltransferase [Dehalococcoidia bacterium]MDD5494992.1 protein-L-isoaspartate(D-aspartate) O-methyltransferase [Dehalococcoidia bacterium]
MDFDRARARLVELFGAEIRDKRVLTAIAKIPRELFIPENLQPCAYDDRPLGIGFGQTISQPFIVALMTQALDLKGPEKVLEIGTGSGYQAAILAELAESVYSVERIPELAESARNVLHRLGYSNVNIKVAGEEMGWKEFAPYDAIVVTAAAPVIHNDFVEQLTVGGRLVIPVGSRWEQELIKLTRGENKNHIDKLGGCRFVPLIGKDAWEE